MDNVAATFEMMVNTFTDADELMNFAATWGIQDSPVVRFQLFQLRNPQYNEEFVNEQLDNILENFGGAVESQHDVRMDDIELALEYVREREEIEGALKALLFDDEMNAITTTCLEDGDWNPPSPVMQIGAGEEPQPGPSHRPDPLPSRGLQYTIRKKSERTYAKNAAVDRTSRYIRTSGVSRQNERISESLSRCIR